MRHVNIDDEDRDEEDTGDESPQPLVTQLIQVLPH
jgi:hypothetical protein